jgi:hypothetical protein
MKDVHVAALKELFTQLYLLLKNLFLDIKKLCF